MDDQNAPNVTNLPSPNGEMSPLPSLVATPSSNNSFSPRTPASPTYKGSNTAQEESPTSAPKLDVNTTAPPDLSSQSGSTSPTADGPTQIYPSFVDKLASYDLAADALARGIAPDDFSIGADGSYLETTNATAARELKRTYDKQLGVGKPGVRSPYAITVAQDAQGRMVYRLGQSRADGVLSSPAVLPNKTPEVMSKSRRLRLSVGALLTPRPVKSSQPQQNIAATTNAPASGTTIRKPPTKLVRNARSTSELRSRSAAVGHSRYKQSTASSNSGIADDSNVIRKIGNDGDVFSFLLGWTETDTGSIYSSGDSADSHGPSSDDSAYANFHHDEHHLNHPFGKGVSFVAPSRPLDLSIRRPSSPPQLRYMQSFESGLTARADDQDRLPFERPTSFRPATRMTSKTHSSASPYSTEVFEVLQTYKGIPLASTLSAVATETTYRLTSTLSAVPKNDPRFVIWGDIRPEDVESAVSPSDASSVTSESKDIKRRRGSASVTDISTTQSNGSSSTASPEGPEPLGQRVIVAATIERWIAQLTSELNYVELLDFFLTYRVYIHAIDLCQLLICRFHWALEVSTDEKNSTQDEIVKKIVRVRTFIAFRYWLSTFFQIDFLRNRELCKLLTGWLNSLKADEGIVGQNQDVLDIVRKLKKVVRECKAKWFYESKSSTASTTDSSERRPSESGSYDAGSQAENEDDDVDLDPVDPMARGSFEGHNTIAEAVASAVQQRSTGLFPNSQPMPPRPSDVSASTISPSHPSVPGANSGLSQLHDLQATILAQAKPAVHLKSTAVAPLPVLPMHQSAISRTLVNAMGRLGRWKRVLNSRSAVPIAPCNEPAAFDLDVNSDSDRELSITPRIPLTPGRRGAAFTGGWQEYVKNANKTPPTLGRPLGSGLSATEPSGSSPQQSEEDVVEEIMHEAGTTVANGTQPPRRHLLRTASAIPLNSRLLRPDSEEANESGPAVATDEVPSTKADIEISTGGDDSTPKADSDSEPTSPPGLEIPAHLVHTLHRPVSTQSMRRISEYKSSPLATSQVLPAAEPKTSPVEEEPPNIGETPSIEQAVEPRLMSLQVRNLSAVEMDAHHSFNGDFDMDSLNDELDDDYHRGPEIVALDDYNLSSSGSESDRGDGVPRLRRMQRRLPTRRDFEFVRRSIDSVSSLGIRSSDAHSSVASGSGLSTRSRASQAPVEEDRLREILPWHLDLIEDSDDEGPQDAEAALARLEGQIDASTQKEKIKKVDRWMRMVAARMQMQSMQGNIGIGDVKEEDEEADTAVAGSTANPSLALDAEVVSAESSRSASVVLEQEANQEPESTVVSVSVSMEEPEEGKTEENVPVEAEPETELLQQREASGAITPTPPSLSGDVDADPNAPITPTISAPPAPLETRETIVPPASADTAKTFQRTSLASKRRGQNTSSLIRKADMLLGSLGPSKPIGAPLHRSFILMHRSEALARHLAMIEKDLFLTIKFGEIVSGSWATHDDRGEVLDWASYIKQRSRIKVEAKTKGVDPDISDVAAIRARFNLMSAFVATDIVLSHPNERPVIFSKVVRVAWKSYMLNDFASVVALISGLQLPAVSLAMSRLWSRVGMWETRVFDDLKEFTSPKGNFKYIREAVEALSEARPPKSDDRAASTGGPPPNKGKAVDGRVAVIPSCVPFIGIYVSDLHRYRKLPDYIDPTCPTHAVTIDKATGSLSAPRHSEVFSTLAPLPPSIPLEPLINVQKQRLTAGIVKQIVSGQHLATKISFDLDRKLYQKCLRLKALPPEKLIEVAKSYGGDA